MFQFLLKILPKEIVCEIILFEGRVFRAYLRDYISELYTDVYKRQFSWRHSIKFITGGFNPTHDREGSLPFYAAWSTIARLQHPRYLKHRKPKNHMTQYAGILTKKQLVMQREKMEIGLQQYFSNYDFTKKEFIAPKNRTEAYLQHFLIEAQGIIGQMESAITHANGQGILNALRATRLP